MRHPFARILLIGGLAVLLTACAKPTAMTPQYTAAEVEAERARQKDLAHGTVKLDYDEIRYGKREKIAMQNHLQRVVDRLAPEATKLCRELNGPQANCDMHVEISSDEKAVNAHADGKKIVINAAMIDFAKDDNHLALVVAHEYAHHMMKHVASSQTNVIAGALLGTLADALAASQGMGTNGQFGKLGAQASLLAYSPSFEQEADYIGMYMLSRAGFDIDVAPEFWRRMAQYNPKGIDNRTTHPTTPERYVSLRKTIEEIKAKKQSGQRLLPNMKPKS